MGKKQILILFCCFFHIVPFHIVPLGAQEPIDKKPLSKSELAKIKEQYTLWNPVPKEYMREFTSDRPTLSDSPYTIDAGHLQVESDFVGYTSSHQTKWHQVTYTTVLNAPNPVLRLGLLENLEFELEVPTFERQYSKKHFKFVPHTPTGSARMTTSHMDSGLGDVRIRFKQNLLGNEGGFCGLAFVPFVKLPTASAPIGNQHVEGGATIPINFNLGKNLTFFGQTQFDILLDDNGTAYHPAFSNYIGMSLPVKPISDDFQIYSELYTIVSGRSVQKDPVWVSIGTGVIDQVTDNLQLDANIAFGQSPSAPDYVVFTGVTWRY